MTENELLRNESSELKAENERLNKVMSSWTKSLVSLKKLHESQKPINDKSSLGFNVSESSSGETSTQSQLVYDKFKRMSFAKASVIHDPCESVRYHDQISEPLHKKGKAGIGFDRPESSKSGWLKNRLDKEKAKAGSKSFVQNQQRRDSRKGERKDLQLRYFFSGFFALSQPYSMASSLIISSSLHVSFDSVLAMDDTGIVAMFGTLVASGLKGFLGCPAIFYENSLTEFFQNGSVRDGMVVSTIQGTSVEISEEIFAGAFALPMDGLTDLSEIPKDLVFDARSIFSNSGEQLSTSCKKREIKIEFRLLSDILAKSIFVKAGSFDAVTHEHFLLMAAITGGVQINWRRLLFNIFKEMVTAGSRQANGYAIQICVLLKDVPALELGDSKAFPSPRILTEKTVHRYVVINEKVTVEEVANKPMVKRTKIEEEEASEPTVENAPVVKSTAEEVRTTSADDVDLIIEQVIAETAQNETDEEEKNVDGINVEGTTVSGTALGNRQYQEMSRRISGGRPGEKRCATGWRNQRHAPHTMRQACGQAPHADLRQIIATAEFFF
ncbi:hypothetical protein F511_20464 [Dorcoceras hygrometricum]|uniref:Dystroglycan-like n=1 Tax=Dorcoceras hygrometricum TaxID=472368 RepID=A0A2Z7AHE4_9LAMI|nr:hypothetical protein F511_20464 [Dorcoceras hygrometricum]